MGLFRKKNQDLTQGNLVPLLLSFALPLFIGNVIQVLFNLADQAVVAQFGSEYDIASIGATSAISGLCLQLVIGLSCGVSVLLPRLIGEKNDGKTKRMLSTALWFSLFLGLGLALLLTPFSRLFLTWTNCPAECADGAALYLIVYFLGAPFYALYNFGAAALRSAGDAQKPTLYLVLSGGANVLLNVLFCLVLPNKIAAVAIATVFSNAIGAVLTLRRLIRMDAAYRFDGKFLFSRRDLGKLIRYGLPSAIAALTSPISYMQIQAAVNLYGASAVAGNSVCSVMEGFLTAVGAAYSSTIATFVGQNLGAGNVRRAEKSLFWCLLTGVALTYAVFGFIALARPVLFPLLLPNDTVAREYFNARLLYFGSLYGIHTFGACLCGYIQAFGYTNFVMIEGFFTSLGFRIFWMQVIYPAFPSYRNAMLCSPVSWICSIAIRLGVTVWLIVRYRKKAVKSL